MITIQDTIAKVLSIQSADVLKEKNTFCRMIEDLSPTLVDEISFINKIYDVELGKMLFDAYNSDSNHKEDTFEQIKTYLYNNQGLNEIWINKIKEYFSPIFSKPTNQSVTCKKINYSFTIFDEKKICVSKSEYDVMFNNTINSCIFLSSILCNNFDERIELLKYVYLYELFKNDKLSKINTISIHKDTIVIFCIARKIESIDFNSTDFFNKNPSFNNIIDCVRSLKPQYKLLILLKAMGLLKNDFTEMLVNARSKDMSILTNRIASVIINKCNCSITLPAEKHCDYLCHIILDSIKNYRAANELIQTVNNSIVENLTFVKEEPVIKQESHQAPVKLKLVKSPNYCIFCGAKLVNGASYCIKCGKKV